MRKIDWNDELSDDDIVWLRQTGIMGIEDRIAAHQAQYDVETLEPDIVNDPPTVSVLDPEGRGNTPAMTGDGPKLIDPTRQDPPSPAEDELEDDYDKWTVEELEAEVVARNGIENTSNVEVIGTGAKGNIVKADFIKGLRLWDEENPGALN